MQKVRLNGVGDTLISGQHDKECFCSGPWPDTSHGRVLKLYVGKSTSSYPVGCSPSMVVSSLSLPGVLILGSMNLHRMEGEINETLSLSGRWFFVISWDPDIPEGKVIRSRKNELCGIQLTFTKCFPCARYQAKWSTLITHCIPTTVLWGKRHYSSFRVEETVPEKLNILSEITQLVSGRARVWT